ncbi:putative 3-hydroxyacyl-CoA dehydrogenase [Paraphoma chrysanthemicola]|uniref:3-hydroxyacyl-CoA dehydrogenase n=1 Tax=Paraphoma chrysanthemicola TaxID=798071 RepID=A0A8K0RJB9_9PLEO|nr:putative 3-hydroxyacyl-CoA dehydrogenase [Paraphoma chrysanthemicola]
MSFTKISKDLSSLKGKTLVITGGASGIGAAIVRLASKSGAHVVFGDLNEVLGRRVAVETGATYLNSNAAEYLDILKLFQEAHKRFGAVDHAVSNAGIYEPKPDPFDVALDLESVKEVPSTTVFDVNVRGTAYFSRIASVYLRQNAAAADDKSLILISSVSGVICPPDTPFYNTSKSAVTGLARTLAQSLPASHNIRVNTVCPSLTRTPLASVHMLPFYEKHNIPFNEASDIADVVLFLACARGCNRKILWVEGATSWDIEEELLKLMPQWIGEGPAKLIENIERINASEL